MFSWPRIRIVFFWIGLISTLIWGYEALGLVLSWFVEVAEWLKEMTA